MNGTVGLLEFKGFNCLNGEKPSRILPGSSIAQEEAILFLKWRDFCQILQKINKNLCG